MSDDYEYYVSIDFDMSKTIQEEEGFASTINDWCRTHCSDEWTCAFIFSNARHLGSVNMGFRNEMDACLFKLSF